MWPKFNTIQANAILLLFCKFGESKLNPRWLIMLTSSSGINYVPNEHEKFEQYDSYAKSSEIMPCYSYAENSVKQNEISVDLSR